VNSNLCLVHLRDEIMRAPFADRREAGRALARQLRQYAHVANVLVLGLPRGGVPVAFEVALALHAPLDVFVVRKLGVPGYEEAAFGAIASGGVRVVDPAVIAQLNMPAEIIDMVTRKEQRELERRERLFRPDREFSSVAGRTVILVDDGIATGATMYAAVEALRRQQPAKVIVAAPVASPSAVRALSAVADACVCAIVPEGFQAVGYWYEDFAQTTDEEVRQLLSEARVRTPTPTVHPHTVMS
jgi:predicted phosphoribosyltransferase